MENEITRAVTFLESIGLTVRRSDVQPSRTFVPGVWCDHGTLVYNPRTLRLPSDLYHEAGHLAVVPALFRPLIPVAMDFDPPPPEFQEHLHAYMNAHPEGLTSYPEDPVCRGILQMGETEAIAWSYAAMVAAGCNLRSYWKADPRNFNGAAPEVRSMLDGRAHLGINGLQAAGMTTVRTFPTMTRWLQV